MRLMGAKWRIWAVYFAPGLLPPPLLHGWAGLAGLRALSKPKRSRSLKPKVCLAQPQAECLHISFFLFLFLVFAWSVWDLYSKEEC